MVAPLTDLVRECGVKQSTIEGNKENPFRWDASHQKAFESIKFTIAHDMVLVYPDFNEEFKKYADASPRQLGAVVVQRNRPVTFFSRKLSAAQQTNSVTELEIWSIIETLKEFQGMLWGQKLKVYIDHQNLTRDTLGMTSNRVILLEALAGRIWS